MIVHATKPVSWFRPDPAQPRRLFDEDELRRLGESLRVRQLQPVLARPDGTLIAGERRLRAARLVGLPELQVLVTDEPLTDTQVRIAQLAENVHRADLRDAEKWKACSELLALNPGWTNRDLAAHLHLSEPTVTKYLSPSRCVPEVQAALEAGALGITDVYTISRAGPEEQRDLLRLKLAGESRDALATRVKRQKAAKLADGKVTAPDLQKFISGAAQSAEALKSDAWQKGYHAQTVQRASDRVKSPIEQHDFDLAVDYWISEFPVMADRTRSSITTGVFGILHVFNSGVVRELVSTTTNVSPDDLFRGKWISAS